MSPQTDALALTPPVLLAPMAGITDLPFRRIVSRFGAGLVVSEMIASQDVMNNRPLALSLIHICITTRGEVDFSSGAQGGGSAPPVDCQPLGPTPELLDPPKGETGHDHRRHERRPPGRGRVAGNPGHAQKEIHVHRRRVT